MSERHSIRYSGFTVWYNDPHDIPAIIESFVLNVYSVQNIKNGDTVVDTGAGIGGLLPLPQIKLERKIKLLQ